MDRLLFIKYGAGKMTIDVNKFFPTSRARIRKLGKILQMDWDHDLKTELLRLLEDRVEEVRAELKDETSQIDRKKADAAEAFNEAALRTRIVIRMRNEKKPKDEIEAAKEKRDRAKDKLRETSKTYHEAVRKCQRLMKEGTALLEDIQVVKNEI